MRWNVENITCRTCGKVFSKQITASMRAEGKGQFCCKPCYYESLRRPSQEPDPGPRKCTRCGEIKALSEFYVYQGRVPSWCKACTKASARKVRAKALAPVVCTRCGKTALKSPSEAAIWSGLCHSCAGKKVWRAKGVDPYKDAAGPIDTERVCEWCGSTFSVRPIYAIRDGGRFCSWPCYVHSRDKRALLKCESCGEQFRLKMSKVRIGYGRFCSPKCKGTWMATKVGEQAAGWRGGISFEPYPPTFNDRFKQMIRERDRHSCAICGAQESKAVHHINYVKDDTIPANCITLCIICHGKTNHRRPFWQALCTEIMTLRSWSDRTQLTVSASHTLNRAR